MNDPNPAPDNPRAPKWLVRTQEQSWEPEILISGIILLALTQVPRLLDKLHYYLEERTSSFWFNTSNADDMVIALLKTSSYWLIAALIAHLMMRSVWVSFVGLSYVYPKGIKAERFKYGSYFMKKVERLPSFEESVIRLERICSSLYATAFLLVMATISVCLYGVVIILVAFMMANLSPDLLAQSGLLDRILIYFTVIVALPYFIDFITLGFFKRLRFIQPVYKYIYAFMSFITLAPVYRGIYYALASNIRKAYLIVGLVLFVVLTALSVYHNDPTGRFRASDIMYGRLGFAVIDGYYRNLEVDRYSTQAHIQAEVIDQGVIELFLVHKVQYEEMIMDTCDATRALRGDTASIDSHPHRAMACMIAWYTVTVDSVEVDLDPAFFREMERTGQLGLYTWIDVSHLPPGPHELTVGINWRPAKNDVVARIPFYIPQRQAAAIAPAEVAADSSSMSTPR